jgi:hypothetical protein
MALQASGPISLADIAAEFGDTPPHSMSEFYRDGGKVPGVNSNVPASGLIRLGNFFGAVNELLQQVTAQASVNAQTIFGSNWGTAVPKRLLIPSGVTIGPLTIPSGLGGSLIVQNQGEIQGYGGGPNSGAGGHAITASSSFTLTNTGAVRGGGGGGGVGGTGGGGSFTSTVSQGPFGSYAVYEWQTNGLARWNISVFYLGSPWSSPISNGGFTYYRGDQFYNDGDGGVFYAISRTYQQTTNTNGGGGGAGGRGRGYGQTPLSGSGGAGGGTNAGVGGTGGSGAEWGSGGATGNTGANGNRTGGSGGAGGGAAGRAVLMLAGSLTLNNSGTINGAY